MRLRRGGRRRQEHEDAPDEEFPFLAHLDEPTNGSARVHSVLVRGWVVVPRGADVEPPIVVHGERSHLGNEQRPDVEAGVDGHVLGFNGLIPVVADDASHDWDLELTVDGKPYRRPLRVTVDEEAHDRFDADKRRKLARIESILRCPRPRADDPVRESCHGELRAGSDGELVCQRCGERYPRSSRRFDFLSEELRGLGGIQDTDNISSWGYDPWATEIIDECSDGLVLDAGSGLKEVYLPNVVNLEIVDYPTTDVLAIGERLPFESASFDAVLSLAVLEHVRDPFRCAAEIARVTKPGGRIYAAVPFLQPYHGYPHHYYNMTLRGLERLFEDDFVIERSGTPAYGLPIWTLTWFLNRYLAGLPTTTAAKLREMQVKDLLAPTPEYLGEDFVLELADDVNTELACTNYVIATKR